MKGTRGTRTRKIVAWVLLVFFALFFLPGLRLPFITPPAPAVSLPPLTEAQRQKSYTVAVLVWGYHTAIVVEQPDGWRLGPLGRENIRFVEYGWGDRKFYKDRDRSFANTFSLLFLGTQSAVYVNGWNQLPTAADKVNAVYRRTASADEVVTLLRTLEQSFPRTDNGPRPEPYPARSQTLGLFYPGREHYIWWHDCNAWAVHRLHDAGLAPPGVGVFTAENVVGRLAAPWSPVPLASPSL